MAKRLKFLQFVLAIILSLQSVGFSLNAIAAPLFGATRTVICTGDGMLTVYLDADGQPVKTEQTDAPDCIFSLHTANLALEDPIVFGHCMSFVASNWPLADTAAYGWGQAKTYQPRAPPAN